MVVINATWRIILFRYSFFECFRSVCAIWVTDENNVSPNTANLKKWLQEYDAWYKNNLKIYDDENLNALYSRNVHLLVEDCKIKHFEGLSDFLKVTKRLGYVCNLHLSLSECQNNYCALRNAVSNTNISIVVDWGKEDRFSNDLTAFSEELVHFLSSESISFVLSGEYKFWRQTNIFRSPDVNTNL